MSLLKNFFYPKSICVAGASSKEKSIGYEILKTIKTYGYAGKVFPVNPKSTEILDYKCFSSINEINESIDLAIVVVPKQFAEDSIDSLLKKNVKSIVLITAGFKEIGKEGEELEKRIVDKIKNAGARLVGPNCMGIISTLNEIKLNATFVAEKPETGTTAFLSQSGALGAGILNSLRETDIKFAHFISVGNKADINENDILNFWQGDENVKTLTFYLESFIDGKNFIFPFINGAEKPAIVLKAGRTESGMKAASSHTGALSGKDKIVDALLKQFGVIRADNLNELFNTAKGFEFFKIPKGDRIAVVTNAGGPGILCVDKIESEGLRLAKFSDETKTRLRKIVHPEGSVENPVDLLPGGAADIFKSVNEIICSDENVDAVISIFVEPVMVSPFEVIENVYSIKNEKPILQAAMPLPEFWNKYREQSIYKLPVFRNPEDPAEVLSNMLFYARAKNKMNANKKVYINSFNSKTSNRYNTGPGFLPQREVNVLCNEYNLPVIKNLFVKENDLQNIDEKLFPVALKGINTKVIHKSELSAVKLNIKTKDELLLAASEIQNSFSKNNYNVEEFLIQPFIKTKHELLIGGFRDPSFGPVIMFGSGGKYVEVLDDSAIKSCYLCDEDIEDMIDSTKIGKILRGVRGEISCDIAELKNIIRSCAKMMVENENISEFDLNPLIVDETNKFFAVDVRVKI
jgi:acetyltransferase